MLQRGNYLEKINEHIAFLRLEIEQTASMGLYNLNRYSEDFVKHILNLVYDCQLENLNGEKSNFPGLDLGDKKKGIAYQVTSTNTRAKIDGTLANCIKYEHYKTFLVINVFITSKKKKSYKPMVNTLPFFSFDSKTNILDFEDILKSISFLKLARIKQIYDYILSEIPVLAWHKTTIRTSLWNVPYSRNPYFTGRSDALVEIRNTLKRAKTIGVSQSITGLGGIGKTQTALEYAFRYRNMYNACFWVVADTEITLTSDLVKIGRLICLPEANSSDKNLVIQAVIRWFETYKGWLLILDNVDTPSLVKQFVPTNPKGHILITSRVYSLDMLAVFKTLSIDQMNGEEALEFLLKRTNRQKVDGEEKMYAVRLVEDLGFLPLAIEQAGAFILAHESKFESYLNSFRIKKMDTLNISFPVMGDYGHSVGTTWLMNFQKIENSNKESANILRLSAFLCPDRIPIELIVDGYFNSVSHNTSFAEGLRNDPIAIDIALEPLVRYSLIRKDLSSNSYSIHRLVQESLKSQMTEFTRKEWAERVVRSIDTIFPSASYPTWELCERLLPHCIVAAKFVEDYGFTFEDAGNLLNGAACYLRMRGDFAESERMHLQSIAVRERDIGPTNSELAGCLNNFALVYYDQYDFSKTGPLLVRALEINVQVLGTDNPELALSYNNLGLFYVRTRDFGKAQFHLEKALELEKKLTKRNEFFYAIIINNLAELYLGLGNFILAESFCLEALDIRERIGNLEKTGGSYNTMAMIQFKLGNSIASESLFKKALLNREIVYGALHPGLIIVLVRYIEMLEDSNRSIEAKILQDRLTEIRSVFKIPSGY